MSLFVFLMATLIVQCNIHSPAIYSYYGIVICDMRLKSRISMFYSWRLASFECLLILRGARKCLWLFMKTFDVIRRMLSSCKLRSDKLSSLKHFELLADKGLVVVAPIIWLSHLCFFFPALQLDAMFCNFSLDLVGRFRSLISIRMHNEYNDGETWIYWGIAEKWY